MMHNIALIKILLSVIFVAVGACVYFLASLISGKNIYKDHGSKLSDISSVMIGAAPFLLLPIGFVIITPDFFIEGFDKFVLHDQVLHVHKLIFEDALAPFLLACSGLGIIVGSLQSLNFRTEFLIDFKKNQI